MCSVDGGAVVEKLGDETFSKSTNLPTPLILLELSYRCNFVTCMCVFDVQLAVACWFLPFGMSFVS